MRKFQRSWLLALMLCGGLALSAAALAAVARADEPGAGSAVVAVEVPDVLTAKQAAEEASNDAVYEKWVSAGTVSAQGMVAPKVPIPVSRVLTTPSRKQINGYYCGPATVQIISGYWGANITQGQAASYMGTTTAGTDFTLVDNALRAFTGRTYTQGPICTIPQAVYNSVQFAIGYKVQPAAGDYSIVGKTWNRYTHDHRGHIITTEGYDWQVSSPHANQIRLDDSFNEADYYPDGGQTYGHQWYPRGQIADGVLKSTSPADRRFLIY